MKLVFFLIPFLSVVSACSPELMIYDAHKCKGAARRKGITKFKAYKRPTNKYPAGCSFHRFKGIRIAHFVPGESTMPCSTTAQPTPYNCICKGLPDIRKTLVNKHRKQ